MCVCVCSVHVWMCLSVGVNTFLSWPAVMETSTPTPHHPTPPKGESMELGKCVMTQSVCKG